jgi:predicted cupin superfamily sugar epimerase
LPCAAPVRIFDVLPWVFRLRTDATVLTAEQVRELLKLRPLPVEGGYFAESYQSKDTVRGDALPPAFGGTRLLGSAIYYMLTPDTFSALHRLRGDEIYHFYLGDPVEMLLLKPDGSGHAVLLGPDIAAGMHLQYAVEGGTWQGSRLAAGGRLALLGTTMAPGFDPADYEIGKRQELSVNYPIYAPLIALLTR